MREPYYRLGLVGCYRAFWKSDVVASDRHSGEEDIPRGSKPRPSQLGSVLSPFTQRCFIP